MEELKNGNIPEGVYIPWRLSELLGRIENTKEYELDARSKILNNTYSDHNYRYDKSKYRFFLDAPFNISGKCCSVMKKKPVHKYAKETGRNPMTAQTASESRLRTEQWLKNGCNGFDMKRPISNPMSFWTEQDVLLYIYNNHIQLASVYGDVVKEKPDQLEGQMDLSDLDAEKFGLFDLGRPVLKTTGCSRTGCMFCGYGCHLDKGKSRFERMKETHPKQYNYIMKPLEEGGLGYKDVIDWINENGNINIRY